MSSPISSCTGPSWIDSATRRRTSLSAWSVRRVSPRARRRDADSAVRSVPTTRAVRERGQHEAGLVEGEQVARRPARRRASAWRSPAPASRSAATARPRPLALEVGVRGDRGRAPPSAPRRASRAPRPRAGPAWRSPRPGRAGSARRRARRASEHEHRDGPGQRQPADHERRLRVVGQAERQRSRSARPAPPRRAWPRTAASGPSDSIGARRSIRRPCAGASAVAGAAPRRRRRPCRSPSRPGCRGGRRRRSGGARRWRRSRSRRGRRRAPPGALRGPARTRATTGTQSSAYSAKWTSLRPTRSIDSEPRVEARLGREEEDRPPSARAAEASRPRRRRGGMPIP